MSGKGTAKGRADIKSSDEKNNVEAMTADELLTSQEFPPQNKLTKRVIAFPFDYDLPIKATEEFISIIENIREQTREETIKEVRQLKKDIEYTELKINAENKDLELHEFNDIIIDFKELINNVITRLKQLGEGEKK